MLSNVILPRHATSMCAHAISIFWLTSGDPQSPLACFLIFCQSHNTTILVVLVLSFLTVMSGKRRCRAWHFVVRADTTKQNINIGKTTVPLFQ